MSPSVRRRLVRMAVTLAIALVATGFAVLAEVLPKIRDAVAAANEVPYDAIYKLRSFQKRTDVPIVIVEVDDASLVEASQQKIGGLGEQWPWPRALWGAYVGYFQDHGARCVVFDLHFTEPAVRGGNDDEAFAAGLDAATVPVVLSGVGNDHRFAPPVQKPVLIGDSNMTAADDFRTYTPDTPRGPSLALLAVRAAGLTPKLPTDCTFRLFFYGPHRWGKGDSVYLTLKASAIYYALNSANPQPPAGTFKDKIVVVGLTAAGLGDIKKSPVDPQYPGCEVQATAIDNLIAGQQIRVAPAGVAPFEAFLLALAAAVGIIFGRPVWAKASALTACGVGLVVLTALPMLAAAPLWLPPVVPLMAVLLSVVTALIFTYRIEDARSRVLLRALGQCVSPHIAAELADEPHRLSVGGTTREMTVLFSDIAGFTALTETLRERIEPVLNFYLGEMSQKAFAADGTIDKYIGDAMMVFWNAPVDQPNHAALACGAALAIASHERAIATRLGELGAKDLRTRIGINTGPVVVGFFGSARRLSYTAIGDAVNLAARLEPGNKNYGTQILVSESTRALAGDGFVFRRLDRLRVYGRHEPAEVFELLGDRATIDVDTSWIAEQFDVAVGRYFAQDWDAADAVLEAILTRRADDGPALVLRERIVQFRKTPPGPGWDGVYTATGK